MVEEVVVRPGKVTIHEPQQFYAGDTWIIGAICQNADGTAMDLTGAAISWRLDDDLGIQTYVVKTAVGGGIVIEPPLVSGDPQNGHAAITVPAADSALLLPGYYRDQLTVISVEGIVETIWQGRVEVLPKLL